MVSGCIICAGVIGASKATHSRRVVSIFANSLALLIVSLIACARFAHEGLSPFKTVGSAVALRRPAAPSTAHKTHRRTGNCQQAITTPRRRWCAIIHSVNLLFTFALHGCGVAPRKRRCPWLLLPRPPFSWLR